MTGLSALWMPILLSSVIVFIVSSVLHTVLPWHKNDYPKLPNEDAFINAVRPLKLLPGDYMVPRCDNRKEMASPEFADKLKQGPVMILTVLPNGPMSMGRNLGLWFVYTVIVGVLAAYVAGRALPAGAPYRHVFRFVGATAFIGYTTALLQMWIWYRRAWGTTFRATVDGLIYASLTAGTFGWLWPH
jgi:hypothetical protein